MKKTLLIPALILTSSLVATDYNYELSPMLGYSINENNLDLNNNMMFGLEAQFNQIGEIIHPELSIFYGKGEYHSTATEADMFRIAINGVYEYKKIGFITPLAKAGVGYRTLDEREDDTRDTVFFDAGLGAKMPITDNISLKAETIYMLDYNSKRWDSNLAVLVGLNFAFGEEKKKAAPIAVIDGDDDQDTVKNSIDNCPSTPIGTKVDQHGCKIDGDDDNDGVLNSKDKCPGTQAGLKVNIDGCFVDSDDDNDGVLNTADKCPNTSKNVTKVDINGCAELVNLPVNFKFDSAEVIGDNMKHVKEYVLFMNEHSSYKANIVGHTDSQGAKTYNEKLSLKRAEAVKAIIVQEGIDTRRLTTDGKGESSPIASNKTEDGQAQNRRIEIEIIK